MLILSLVYNTSSLEDTLQGKERGAERRRIRWMMILLLPPPLPYLSLSAIDANGRSDFPPILLSFYPVSRARRASEVNWILALLSLPPPFLLRLCRESHCRFCACWDNASHKYHLARLFANIATDRRQRPSSCIFAACSD